jgi:poly(A) polymerase
MKTHRPGLLAPSKALTAASEVVQTLQNAGFEALFAGGCVRDALLGESPKDYDVATAADPETVESLFVSTVPVGKAFGVILVLMDGIQIEVATFRHDGPYSDGRHPDSVAFTDRVEDVKRRDFTVNGLMYDPIAEVVYDEVGGVADLDNRVIRAIGDPVNRFEEDRLRLLRAVRFSCRLGYTLDTTTAEAIRHLAPRITEVSWERIRMEFEKIITHPSRSNGLRMLDDLGLLEPTFPELTAMKGVEQPPEFHPEGDVWVHTLLAMDQLENPSFTLALGTLLHDVGKPKTYTVTDRIRFNQHESVGAEMAETICRRMKCSREEIDAVSWLVKKHMVIKDAPKMRAARFKRLVRDEHFDELVQLFRADILACHRDLSLYDEVQARVEEVRSEPLCPAPLITGKDLISLGLTPGPDFTALLAAVEDAQLENRISTAEEALSLVREMLNSPS